MSKTFIPAYDALTPRFPRAELDKIKRYSNDYFWATQWLMEPSLGNMIYFDLTRCPRDDRPRIDYWWVACDLANTATDTGSRSAFVAVGFDEQRGRLSLMGCEYGRWRQDEMQDHLLQFCQAMMRLSGRPPLKVIVERAAGGFGVLDLMRSTLPQMEAIIPRGSKEIRAGDVCPLVNRGQLSLPTAAPWLGEFEKEVGGFPLESNSDITDAFVHCLKFAISPGEFKEPPPQEGVMVYDSGAGGWDGMPGGHDDGDSLESSDEFRRMLGAPGNGPSIADFGSEHERLDSNLLNSIDPDGSKRRGY